MVEIPAHSARRVSELLDLVHELPCTPAHLRDDALRIDRRLEEQLPPARARHTMVLQTRLVHMDHDEAVEVAGFLDLLSGAPSTPPDVGRDIADCADQMWQLIGREPAERIIRIPDVSPAQA